MGWAEETFVDLPTRVRIADCRKMERDSLSCNRRPLLLCTSSSSEAGLPIYWRSDFLLWTWLVTFLCVIFYEVNEMNAWWWNRDHRCIQFPKRLSKQRWTVVLVIYVQNWLEKSFLPSLAKLRLDPPHPPWWALSRSVDLRKCVVAVVTVAKNQLEGTRPSWKRTVREVTVQELFLRALAKLQKATISFAMLVRPSVWNNSTQTEQILIKCDV